MNCHHGTKGGARERTYPYYNAAGRIVELKTVVRVKRTWPCGCMELVTEERLTDAQSGQAKAQSGRAAAAKTYTKRGRAIAKASRTKPAGRTPPGIETD